MHQNTSQTLIFAAFSLTLLGCGDTSSSFPFEATDTTATSPDATSNTGLDLPLEDTQTPEDSAQTEDIQANDTTPDAPSEDATPDTANPDVPNEDTDIPPSPLAPAFYPTGQTHSPITPYVVENITSISNNTPGRNDHAFSKIGDSITVSTSFLNCFAGNFVDLGAHEALRPSLEHFLSGWADGTTPFDRASLAATGGWPAFRAIEGSPSPLDSELAQIDPRFAVVMFGTNDIGWDNIARYADNMLDITDTLIAGGVIPLLTTVPPRDDDRVDGAAQVPRYNAVIRAIAQARQVPLIDYHHEMAALPEHGLSQDNVHPNTFRDGGSRPCFLTSEGLQFGYNTRNLVTLTALHRARLALLEQESPDAPAAPLQGTGSPADPFIIDTFPFSDLRNTQNSPHRNIDTYPGCNANQNESGPELTYQLRLDRAASIRAMVFDRGDVDIDLHLLDQSATAEGCLERDHQFIVMDLAPGTYTFVLDTFVNGSNVERTGEYLFVVMEE